MTADAREEARPEEVIAIASDLLKIIAERISCSDEMLVAALKVAAITIEETKSATFTARLRAGMLIQYQGKR